MGKKRSSDVSDDQIIAAYAEIHSIQKVAKRLGIGATTIHRVLRTHGIERVGLEEFRENITRFKGQEHEIRAAYDGGATMDDLSRQFGEASVYAFKHAIRRAGGALRPNPVPRASDDELARIKALHDAGMGQMQISIEIGRSQTFVSRAMKRAGIDPIKLSMESHPNWKGGRARAGPYWRILVSWDDPMAVMANSSGYVMEHRLVVARRLGRPLLPTETVHHIDGDEANNADSNLQLHQGRHGKGVVMCCLDCGSRNIGSAPIAS